MTADAQILSDDFLRDAALMIMKPPGWERVTITRSPAFWTITGFYHGRFHGGHRADPVSLASTLHDIALREHEAPAPPVVVEIVEAPAPPPPPPPVIDPSIIPEELAGFAETWESAADFRDRVKKLWQRFGIADGHHFPGGGEALTSEEKILMREIDIANQKAGNWLSV